jgi:hypothetical protein
VLKAYACVTELSYGAIDVYGGHFETRPQPRRFAQRLDPVIEFRLPTAEFDRSFLNPKRRFGGQC